MKTTWFYVFSAFLFIGISGKAQFPAGFERVPFAEGISSPTTLSFAPDGRIFIAEQGGKLRVVKNGTLLPDPFITITVNSTDERGLLGIAFDPDFETNQFIYLYYTSPSPLNNRISRFTANGDVVVPGSELVILNFNPLTAGNHNGGPIAFGPDGKLYVGLGENANGNNAQDPDTYLGKILRINKDGTPADGNPFTTGSDPKLRTWALGVRNPYSFAFQPATGKFFVNDVGQSTWEEIDDMTTGGGNYGWPSAEGTSANPEYVNPIYKYAHGNGDGLGCAITGGTFFNPSNTNYPSFYYGKYFFLDYCGSWINCIDVSTGVRSSFATNIGAFPVDLKTGPDGNLYYLSHTEGKLYKVSYTLSSPPFIVKQPDAATVPFGESATFGVEAIGTLPFAYQWKFNGEDIDGATSSTLTIDPASTDHTGLYRVVITNAGGTVSSDEVQLTVEPMVLGVYPQEHAQLKIYPNPAPSGDLRAVVQAERDQVVSFVFVDILGRRLTLPSVQVLAGDNHVDLNTNELAYGVYNLMSVIDGKCVSGRVIIR